MLDQQADPVEAILIDLDPGDQLDANEMKILKSFLVELPFYDTLTVESLNMLVDKCWREYLQNEATESFRRFFAKGTKNLKSNWLKKNARQIL